MRSAGYLAYAMITSLSHPLPALRMCDTQDLVQRDCSVDTAQGSVHPYLLPSNGGH